MGYREGQRWIAHCLELDIVAQGDTPIASVRQLVELVDAQITDALSRDELESVFFPAPSEYWNLFARAVGEQPRMRMPRTHRMVESLDYRAVGAFAPA